VFRFRFGGFEFEEGTLVQFFIGGGLGVGEFVENRVELRGERF
jgi:hypothetical protein